MEKTTLNERTISKTWIVLILGSLTAFGPLSMDMYLPSLPTVATDLGTTTSFAQLSLTACLLGLAFGQLIFGPLSDIKGRRKPLLFTLIIYSVASILCAFSSSIWMLIGLRFVQGFSGAAGIVIARASARDMYDGKDLTKFVALLSLVNGAAPILAPIFGGMVLKFAPWPIVFIVLAIIGILMLISVIFILPETLPVERRATGGVFATVKTFGSLVKDRSFIGLALTQAFIMTAMFAYIAGSPFVLQKIYGLSPQAFSLFFGLNGIGIIFASQLTGKLSEKVAEIKLLFSGILIAFAGSLLLVSVITFKLPLVFILIALFIIVSTVGIVSTTAFSLSMQKQGNNAGSASALLGLLPFIGGAVVSPLVGIAGEMNAWPMGIIILSSTLFAIIAFLSIPKN
ncbi:multidrug effflux MFS transporter [Viridibacillus sp. NPDC093762]|uniref:multidrug effflux MFS transporter n=1 Tax=Viridibacillus sp. NPDC093762 TaxID=3390720 RepID=UPI003D08223F